MAELPYRIVIGLEVHVQLLTHTKLFCGCSTKFGLPPNTATCPVCIGMPGVLPVMNRRAFELAVRAALALHCEIAAFTKWDRKNYYYPDLPKNYQISQFDLPFSHDGGLEIETASGTKKIGIIRVHLEEDAGKMLHDEKGGGTDSLVDLNRAGTPLCEIVSKPDISGPDEAKAYLDELKLILRELGISDCEMQEGSLRCDANVNLHLPQSDGGHIATPITELKNLNSFTAVQRAVKWEAAHQYEQFQKDGLRFGQVAKKTKGWDDAVGCATLQREKEEVSDYRYFPEPDLVPVLVDPKWLRQQREALGELPAERRTRLQADYGLSAYDSGVLTAQGRSFGVYFEEVARVCGDAKAAANWLTNDVLAKLNADGIEIEQFQLRPAALAELIAEQKKGLNAQRAREVFGVMLASEGKTSVAAAMKQLGLGAVVSDPGQLREIVKRAIANNPKAVADFKRGRTEAANAIKGAVMKETKKMANMELVQQLLLEELQNV